MKDKGKQNLYHQFSPFLALPAITSIACHFLPYLTLTHIFRICYFAVSAFYLLHSDVVNVIHTRSKWIAGEKRISSHLWWTVADWYMVHNVT